jgi:hypothetical protein
MNHSPDGFGFDEFAIVSQLPDQRIDLAQAQWKLRIAFQVAADERIGASAGF